MLCVGCIGARYITTFMLFLGMSNAYVMRTNMSVAIVAMVNHTALPVHLDILEDECPDESAGLTVSSLCQHNRTLKLIGGIDNIDSSPSGDYRL